MKNTIVLKGVKKSFGDCAVLAGIDLSIKENEAVALIGPSGAGKTTLLRIIAGLEPRCDGKMTVNGRVGMVFQHSHLWPHKTVLENVTEALKSEDAQARAESLLDGFGLSRKASEYPDSLSGGETQRVAIARTLATNPDIILLDEITSALDPILVKCLLKTLKSLLDGRKTIVLVTHEMSFAKEVSQRVLFLDKGQIVEEGPPEQIFHNPRKRETLAFIGSIKKR